MKNKIIFSILFLLFLFPIYSQEKIEINVPSFDDKTGLIKEEIYTRDMPSTYEECVILINTLIDIYEEVNFNYKAQIEDYENYTKEITAELESAKSDNKKLKELISDKDEIDKIVEDNSNFFTDNFEGIGILGEYGTSWSRNDISILIGFKFWKFTFIFGPDIYFPNSKEEGNISMGLRSSIGFWF